MASHPIWCAIKSGGTYNDVTTDVLQTAVLRSVRGAQDETGGLRPSKVELTLKDITAAAPQYDPDHPLSPLYGIAGRNSRMLLGHQIVQEGFESATPAIARVDAGSAFWARSTTDAHTGTWSLKAGTITNSQVSDVTFTTPAGATACSIWYKVSSASGDGLQIKVNGGPSLVNLAGITGWLQIVLTVTAGDTVLCRYTKDAAGAGGSDTAWIDDITFYNSRNAVELSSWQPDQDEAWLGSPGVGMRWTALQGEGVLRRIGRWSDRLRSPVYRQITGRIPAGRLLGYWPGEDPVGATALTNAVPGGSPGVALNVQYAAAPALDGTDALLKLTGTSKVTGRFLKPTGTPNGWQISWVFQFDASAPVTQTQVMTWTTSNGYRWYLNASSTQFNIQCADASGTFLDNTLFAFSGADPVTNGVVFRIKVSAAAGTVSVETAWYAQGNNTPFGITDTFAGTTGYLLSWAGNGNLATDGMTFGHVYAVQDSIDDLQDFATLNAFNGYRGETAGDRFLRLLGYWGITGQLLGNSSDTQPMGPQKSDTAINLLKEIQQTEDGPLYDSNVFVGLVLRTRKSMYNQAAKITLTRAQLNAPLQKVTDDLVTGNQVTVSNRSGGEATVSVLTGPGSVLDPPAGAGLYQQTVKVNVASDGDLGTIAGWYAAKLSDTTARFPQVTVDLDAQPGLETAVNSVQIGDRIVLTGIVSASDTIGLIVLGYTETWTTQFRRRVTFVCAPDTVFNPAVYDAGASTKYDSLSTTLGVARDAVQTAWTISTTDPEDVWSTTGTPYGWIVNGEPVTVTVMNAATGTGPYTQTCTVTRSGTVAKAHAVGEAININSKARYGR